MDKTTIGNRITSEETNKALRERVEKRRACAKEGHKPGTPGPIEYDKMRTLVTCTECGTTYYRSASTQEQKSMNDSMHTPIGPYRS